MFELLVACVVSGRNPRSTTQIGSEEGKDEKKAIETNLECTARATTVNHYTHEISE